MKKAKAKDAPKEAAKGLFNFGGKPCISSTALLMVACTRLSFSIQGMTMLS